MADKVDQFPVVEQPKPPITKKLLIRLMEDFKRQEEEASAAIAAAQRQILTVQGAIQACQYLYGYAPLDPHSQAIQDFGECPGCPECQEVKDAEKGAVREGTKEVEKGEEVDA